MFAKRPNENVWYGPEKTVERHLDVESCGFHVFLVTQILHTPSQDQARSCED